MHLDVVAVAFTERVYEYYGQKPESSRAQQTNKFIELVGSCHFEVETLEINWEN